MSFSWYYHTPKGFDDLYMCSDGEVLTGLGFVGQGPSTKKMTEHNLPIFHETCHWLDEYFAGRPPKKLPSFRLLGATPFRQEVSEEMRLIPFGNTVTYGEIAAAIARHRGVVRMSAQAVGRAAGWNPICIIIPCHRVIGTGGALTGYGGGIHNKMALLEMERQAVR